MDWADGFIAADWGTTNRRAYLVGPDGALQDEMEDGKGILSVSKGGFPEAVAELRARLGDRPMLLAGMIGSNRGWVEAPYVAAPAGGEEIARQLVWPESGRTAIVPGVSYLDGQAADVMRGEEVQIVGAVAAGLVPTDCLLCHPGTHNKWVELRGGRIAAFRTVMTGEIFNLLKNNSILADLLGNSASPDRSFASGVGHGLAADDLTAELFSVRARVLLGRGKREEAPSYISGLLIGADVRIGMRMRSEEEIIVMGRPELTGLYAAGLAIAGCRAREVDGERAFLAGVRHLAEHAA
jgi:2-dehydro-3-deoxygalactonokinase